MLISVVIPVYNEKTTIMKIVQMVKDTKLVGEIIVVDDCSSDGTREILEKESLKEGIRVFYHERNKGKGAAIRTGFEHVTGDIVIIQDADLEYDPKEYKELIKPMQDGFADVVYGSRMLRGKPQRVHMFWHKVGNEILTLLANFLYNTTLTDMETGYKVFHKDVIKKLNLKSNGFSIESEITAKVFKCNKYRVYEVPVSYYGRTYQEGKKITWRQGVSAIVALFWYRIFD
ncbi:MAG: glycosyltransferase family 2 protein [Candidatus Omnitrophota bacterium]